MKSRWNKIAKDTITPDNLVKEVITPITDNVTVTDTEIQFGSFWELYNKKEGRKACKIKWGKLKPKVRQQIFDTLPDYLKAHPERKYLKLPLTYLNGEHWNDELITQKPNNGYVKPPEGRRVEGENKF